MAQNFSQAIQNQGNMTPQSAPSLIMRQTVSNNFEATKIQKSKLAEAEMLPRHNSVHTKIKPEFEN